MLITAIIAVLSIGLTVCQRANAQSLMPYAQRVEIAKKLLAVDREAALANPQDTTRSSFFTRVSAEIDPQWTADFMIQNPLPDRDKLAYENRAIVALLKRPDQLSETQIEQLVEYHPFIEASYLRHALNNLPHDSSFDPVRKKLIQRAVKLCDQMEVETAIGSFLPIAGTQWLADEPELVEKFKSKIHGFYHSGAVEIRWKDLSSLPSSVYFVNRIKHMAPTGFDLSFLGKFGAANISYGSDLQLWLTDHSLTEEQKKDWLDSKTVFRYPYELYELKQCVFQLGLVAKYDQAKALAWASQAPNPLLRLAAELSIATAVARNDKPAAIQMVKDCYRKCLAFDPTEPKYQGDQFLYSTPPHIIASIGLKVAAKIDKELLSECVLQTKTLIKRAIKPDARNNTDDQIYRSLAALARYDQLAAQEIFDQYSEDVPLNSAPHFFIALAVIKPEHILEEYASLPEQSDDVIQSARFRVRSAILPALVQRDEEVFWKELQGYIYIEFPNITAGD